MFNSDSFMEYSFKGKPDRYFYLKLLLAVLVCLFGDILFLSGNVLVGMLVSPLVVVVGIYLFFFVLGYRKMEYEYTLTNGSVEIAAIYKASKRREMMHFEMDQVMMIAPRDSKRIENEKVEVKRKFVSKKEDGKQIALIVDVKKKKQLVIMELDEKCLEHIKLYGKNKWYDD